MKERDLKMLWGRSGNRCALCKLELTPSGDRETVGEMAHIVGRQTNGPRGSDDLPSDERDEYSNLILLCPTHHREIDKNEADWPSDKLRSAKSEHERWVSEMLARGNIAVAKIDNSRLLEDRNQYWKLFCEGGLGICFSLTPLDIESGLIDVLGELGQQTLEAAQLAGHRYPGGLNRYDTTPSEHGICNERIGELSGPDGYSFHLFNSGHCEVVYALNRESERLAEASKDRRGNQHGATKLIRYTELAERVVSSMAWFRQVWEQLLPFRHMGFRVQILSARGLTIYSYEDDWGEGIFGYPASSELLEFGEVYEKSEFEAQIEVTVLQWIARSFRLQLNDIYDQNGKFVRPFSFR